MSELPPEKQIELYKLLLRIRIFEEKAVKMYLAGEMPGFIHAYLGQEAIAAGVCFSLNAEDYITSTHRGHGHCIAKGAELDGMMAELYGKASGHCKGRGGSMHIADFSKGILGANGIVAGGMPIAVGAGLAIKLRNERKVVVCFFGDGAANQGTFHESLNLASIWDLPVVFVCEDNLYGLSVPKEEHMKIENIGLRAKSYGLPGKTLDGNDVLAVYSAAEQAIGRARRGKGPSLLDCQSYRQMGHYVGDPAEYRTKEEEKAWKEKEPVGRFRNQLRSSGTISDEDDKQFRDAILADVQRAIEFARKAPSPRSEEALQFVYYDGDKNL